MKVLVDTCVILDALQHREPFAIDSEAVCLAAASRRVDAFIPAKSVADLYYILHRNFHSDVQTRAALKKLFLAFEILDTTAADCRNALLSSISDFEDALLTETASRNEIDMIVTRNMNDFRYSRVPVISPANLIRSLK